MPISFSCPVCHAAYQVSELHAGKKTTCQCGQRVQVPNIKRSRTILGEVLPDPATMNEAPKPRPTVSPPANHSHLGYVPPLPASSRFSRSMQYGLVALGLVVGMGVISLLLVRLTSTTDRLAPTDQTVTKADAQQVPKGPSKSSPKNLIPPVTPPKVEGKAKIEEPERPLPPKVERREPLSGEEVYRRLLQSAVLLTSRHGLGNGFVAHADKGLIITNAHVVGNEANVDVHFPKYRSSGELLTDPKDYAKKPGVRGQVIEVDTRRDLAVIQLAQIPTNIQAIVFADQVAPTGSTVYSVGGSGVRDRLLWRFSKGLVRGRAEREVITEGGRLACLILETDAPLNPGDSGGAVVNDHGELVAVTSHGHTTENQITGNIDLLEVRKVLQRAIRERNGR